LLNPIHLRKERNNKINHKGCINAEKEIMSKVRFWALLQENSVLAGN
jgi:hypothetical protein